jgi:V/A-type H+-transporting ATPase subunit I
MGDGSVGLIAGLAILIPFVVILGYKWRENQSPLGEKILVVAVEGFESIISYVSNTLSFLRVAAFSLNHVALAIAVFTLADMLGTTGHWISVVLGNVFIIVVEGFIVTIQVLRLEYYEGFSRFFRGDGRIFKPLGYGA